MSGKKEGARPEALLDALSNPTNQAILNLLAVEPGYPRQISDLLEASESDVSRRLARMRRLGLVESEWTHIGKNVKLYRLVPDEIHLRFTPEGLTITLEADEAGTLERSRLDRLEIEIPEPRGIVGREHVLEALDGPEPVVVVDGLAGIGKSTLLAGFARSVNDDRPVFYHTFSGTESLSWLVSRLALHLSRHGDREALEAIEASEPIAERCTRVLRGIEAAEHVVVLDAIERVRDDELTAFLQDAISRVRRGKLVVAGRERPRLDPTLEHVRTLRLGGLDDDGVARLLASLDADVDPALLPRIRAEVGGHPLALTLLVQTAGELDVPIETLLDRIPEQDLETYLLGEVHDHLSEPERKVLAHASIFPSLFTREDLEEIYPGNPGGALVKLRRRRLVREQAEAFALHEVLRNFFYAQLDDPASLHLQAADRALARGTIEGRLEAMEHHLAAGDRSRVLALLEEDLDLEAFGLIEQGYHNLYLGILERLDPGTISDPRTAGLVLDEMGDIRYHRGEHAQALDRYEQAADRFSSLDEAGHRLADLAWKRALTFKALEEPEQAAAWVRRGLEDHTPDERTRERLEALAEELDLEG